MLVKMHYPSIIPKNSHGANRILILKESDANYEFESDPYKWSR